MMTSPSLVSTPVLIFANKLGALCRVRESNRWLAPPPLPQ